MVMEVSRTAYETYTVWLDRQPLASYSVTPSPPKTSTSPT